MHAILHGKDDRLIVVIGPCSIHDPKAARRVRRAASRSSASALAGELEIVMRVYFEKPRTTVGWKGLINDPYLDGSFHINDGLRVARELLLDINELRPAGRLRVPRHDHAAVHRRPGQLGRDRRAHHREPGAPRAGLRPVLPGRLQERHRRQRQDRRRRDPARRSSRIISCRSPRAATRPSSRPPATRTATSSCAAARQPNYDAASVDAACQELARNGLAPRADDRRQPRQQPEEAREPARGRADSIAQQLAAGDARIVGVMVESHLVAGRQDLVPGKAADLRPVDHRRLHRLGRQHQAARSPGRSRARPPPAQRQLHGKVTRRPAPAGLRVIPSTARDLERTARSSTSTSCHPEHSEGSRTHRTIE